MTEIIVPDASVLLKWAFNAPDETDRDKALSFLNAWLNGKVEIILPKLWSFEVGNVLMLKNPEFAHEIMEIFLGYDFDEFDMTSELCREAFKLMKKYKVTFYDTAYHAVAMLNKGILLTADESYCRKASGARNVMRLKDWR
ncbi:MAG: type II toxin-antitoxin system VapC family toxin [Nitrospirae bacterium]|jgi:predicted nucleic acid-binding protein|nr:type II toxin-antitoxin system VapC family toxin [Nitrospirota bacterium]